MQCYKVCTQQVASISAYVDDQVMRSSSRKHIEHLLERTIHFDRIAGQFLNRQNSRQDSCNTKEGANELKTLTVEGLPLAIVQDAKSLGAFYHYGHASK